MIPLTTIELNSCAARKKWNRNRGYGDGRPPLLFLFRPILKMLCTTRVAGMPRYIWTTDLRSSEGAQVEATEPFHLVSSAGVVKVSR